METARAALPELEDLGDQQPPAPVRRTGHVGPGEALLDGGDEALELGPVGDHLALRRRPRADLARARARGEVGVARGVVEPLDAPAHPHLAVQLQPAEHRRRRAERFELAALGARVVGEEREAALVGAADEHDPGVGSAVGVDRAERHRVRLGHADLERLGVPALPLHHRVAVDVGDVEPGRLVLHRADRGSRRRARSVTRRRSRRCRACTGAAPRARRSSRRPGAGSR